MKHTEATLLAAIRAKGSGATTLRDAAHEACHALQWGVKRKWTRDNIHAKKPRARADGVRDEILARAVEQIVCQRLGVDCGSVAHWAMVCWMETLKNERISLPTGDWLEKQILAAMNHRLAARYADAVMSLALGKTKRDAKELRHAS